MIALGASVTDFGLSLARSFDYNDVKWSVGASPKIQRIDMINYVAAANSDFDNFDSDQYTETKTTFNLDTGVTAEWQNGLMLMPPMALIIVACLIWYQRAKHKELQEKE
jgi:hypothetical protein